MDDAVADPAEAASDYGSDFTADEEQILTALLQESYIPVQVAVPIPDTDPPTTGDPEDQRQGIENDATIRAARVPLQARQTLRSPEGEGYHETQQRVTLPRHVQIVFDLGDDIPADRKRLVESETSRFAREGSASIEAPLDPPPETPDHRSPLERFRTKPRKALSVTDLVSTSWCELQYWFTLTKHGKKRWTPAMRRGSAVHKTLEEQVHTTVSVDVTTKEDVWGLRIWNMIQGLRTLQETGMTRELEVWGVVDGQVIGGVIDKLSYTCPDPDKEAALEDADRRTTTSSSKKASPPPPPPLPLNQPTITKFLTQSSPSPNSGAGDGGGSTDILGNDGQNLHEATVMPLFSSSQPQSATDDNNSTTNTLPRKVYITDEKTRSAPTLPKGPALRPTEMQLMLYHRMLTDMATGQLDPHVVFARHGLDPHRNFSDGFLAQMLSVQDNNDDSNYPAANEDSSSSSPTSLVMQNPSLSALSTVLLSALRAAFSADPVSQSQPQTNISPLLTARYLLPPLYPILPSTTSSSSSSSSPSPPPEPAPAPAPEPSTRRKPRPTASGGGFVEIGHYSFPTDPPRLSAYLADTMAWWRGERSARGVEDVAEASLKCGRCEFAAGCEWRAKKVDEVMAAGGRERSGAGAGAGADGRKSGGGSGRARSRV